jgi:hypothetical protein
MQDEDTIIKYFLFRCGYPDCELKIPYKLIMKKQEGNWNYDSIILEFNCPFCKKRNHFSSRDVIKELSKDDFELEDKISKGTKEVEKHLEKPMKVEWE